MAIPRSLTLVLLLASFLVHASAAKKSYIVYMGEHFHGPNPTEEHFERAAESHRHFLTSFVGSHEKAKEAIIYSYKKHINGFSAVLEDEHAAQIKNHPSVISVFLDKANELHTTRSWDFKGLGNNGVAKQPDSLWTKARFGEDTIIANLDSGVWPESASFDDAGYGPIPKRWRGSCNGGDGFNCNKKLIGAAYYYKGYLSDPDAKIIPSELNTRDVSGHGTHTLSTIGGNFVANVSVNGAGLGMASGGSPRARVATYKVCWRSLPDGAQCFDSDMLAAIDQAIHDGVDIISMSLGGAVDNYFADGIAIGAFHAVKRGLSVVCSAGNNGPMAATVTNVAPWIFTVGASTLDRKFESSVVLGNGNRFTGISLSESLKNQTFYPLTTGALAKLANASTTDAMHCEAGALDPRKAEGKIIVCERGIGSMSSYNAREAGAVGMILCNGKSSGDVFAQDDFIPSSNINYEDGLQVLNYINSTGKPTAYLTPTTGALNKKAPSMANFSSRGPNMVTPEILKPDVTAPGVEIIAAYSLANSPTEESYDNRRLPYNTMSGTSMSCPHVAGLVGLLKTLYPYWTPATIRSAIMTTAFTKDNTGGPILDGSDDSVSDPFRYGAAHINPNAAMDPGLVYDIKPNDYIHLLCSFGYNSTQINAFVEPGHRLECHGAPQAWPNDRTLLHFNYPTIVAPEIFPGEAITFRRRVTNVGPAGTYKVSVTQPKGAVIYVHPPTLRFNATGENKSFSVRVTGVSPSTGLFGSFGAMTWSDGQHHVRSNVVVNVHDKK